MNLHSLNPQAGTGKLYNARVFNLHDKDELLLYNFVMRRYGDKLVNSPPNLFFSSKDGSVHVYIDWLSDYTYEEEFLGESAPQEPFVVENFQEQASRDTSALARLHSRLEESAKARHRVLEKDESDA